MSEDRRMLRWPAPEATANVFPGTGQIPSNDPIWEHDSVYVHLDPKSQHVIPTFSLFQCHSMSRADGATQLIPTTANHKRSARPKRYRLGSGAMEPNLTQCTSGDKNFSATVGGTSSKIITFSLFDATVPPEQHAKSSHHVHTFQADQSSPSPTTDVSRHRSVSTPGDDSGDDSDSSCSTVCVSFKSF